MLVLADLEWVFKKGEDPYPTQLACVRVDEAWSIESVFFSRIRPAEPQPDWSFCAFVGGTPEAFRSASGNSEVEIEVREWLRDDDILCWWFGQSKRMFKRCFPALKRWRSVVLSSYLPEHFQDQAWPMRNQYTLSEELLDPVPEGKNYGGEDDWAALSGPEHFALNDAKVMRIALSAAQFPQRLLQRPPLKLGKKALAHGSYEAPGTREDSGWFLYDPESGIIHQAGCPLIDTGKRLLTYDSLKAPLRKGYQPCRECCARSYRKARAGKNEDTLKRSQFTYVYTPNSPVFHKYTCKAILPARLILGTGKYESCVESGRRPCKLCSPTRRDAPNPNAMAVSPSQGKAKKPVNPLPTEKQRALARFQQAQRERFAPQNREKLSSVDRDDFITLTQPGFAFWSAKGYRNFHTKNCPRLKRLTDLTGFARYDEAVRAGFTPCRQCKPTKKQDVVYSIPITSRKRAGESPQILIDLCHRHGYSCTVDSTGTRFRMETPVGKWQINLEDMPVTLEHINLASPWGDKTTYHRQPRLFLSLADTFAYIHRHDCDIMKRQALAQAVDR